MNTYYKFKFYINGRHSVTFGTNKSNIHPHTWEVVLIMKTKLDEEVNFTIFEKKLEEYFSNYEGKYLNELDKFININPTMENMGKILCEDIKDLVDDEVLILTKIEISENPMRTYIIETI